MLLIMITLLIFSRNRAMQLNSLLTSINKHCPSLFYQIKILYKYDDENYKKGYDKLIVKHPLCEWILENEDKKYFKKYVINSLDTEYCCLMTDDNLIYRDISENEQDDILTLLKKDKILSFLIGVGHNTRYSMTANFSFDLPVFEKFNNCYIWDWKTSVKNSEFNCPFMLAGNIYKTSNYLKYLKNIEFDNPNRLEANLYFYTLDHIDDIFNKSACLYNSVILHSCNNRVQTEIPNPFGTQYYLDTEVLNIEFLNEKELSYNINEQLVNGLHYEVNFKII